MLISVSRSVSIKYMLSDELVGDWKWLNTLVSKCDCVDERGGCGLEEVDEENVWSHFICLVLGWGSKTCSFSLEDLPRNSIGPKVMGDLPTIVVGMFKAFTLQLGGCWHEVLPEAVSHFMEGWPFRHWHKVWVL
ncbi:hypothetical protein HG530_011920 [Fusarium avenaceum]|nr:hypothetical protein HG530_011920 [Fusarium avenaceum]